MKMLRQILVFFCLFFFNLPYFKAHEEESLVHEYTSSNFRHQIESMDGNFIMFYAPWCHHCTDFKPIWSELAELINTKSSKFAIAQVDCTVHVKLCQENDITGYPTLLYFHKKSFVPVEYKGTRDLPSLTLFLSEVFKLKTEGPDPVQDEKEKDVKVYSGMAYLTDQNIEKFVSSGQNFVMFYAPWCTASQKLAPLWAELAVHYAFNEYLKIGKINCVENEVTCKNFDITQYPRLLWIFNGRIVGATTADNLEELKKFVESMLLPENHDPAKFMKKKKELPVARLTEDNFDTFLEKEILFVNYFAPWCSHCMKLSPVWVKLGEKYQNDTRIIIADVDCTRSKTLCEAEEIVGIPTLVLYKNKIIVHTETNAPLLEALVTILETHSKEDPSTVPSSNNNNDKRRDEL